MGMKRVLRQSPCDSPSSVEERFKLNPRVAGRSKWQRIAALQRNKEWQKAYREAWEKFKQGIRDVVFPAGTYWLRVYAGVTCHPT